MISKLGTHNSLTYAEPTTLLGKLFNKTAKCQELTLEEQYNLGVRYFDIRINRAGSNAKHGFIYYKQNVELAIAWLNSMSTEEDHIYVSLNYENGIFERKSKYEPAFQQLFSSMISTYRNLTFVGGYAKHPWRKVIDVKDPVLEERYWEFSNYRWAQKKIKKFFINLLHFNPKYWAKQDNQLYRKQYKSGVLVLDFVNI